MRMWMVDPSIMCRKHLLGEHVEHHMFVGSLKKGISMDRYISENLMEPSALQERHDLLVEEMLKRGYSHNSPMEYLSPDYFKMMTVEQYKTKVNVEASLKELLRRCPECLKNYQRKYPDYKINSI